MHTSSWNKRALAVAVVGLLLVPAMISRPAAAKDGGANIGNSITINPLGFIGWGPDIEWETVTSHSNALALRVKYGSFSLGDWTNTDFGGGISYRWFLQEENPAPRGLWIGPAFDVLSDTSSFKSGTSATTMIYSIYGQLGYKWLLGEKVAFVISPYINLGYNMGSLSVGSDSVNFSGLMFGIGLAIGVAF